MDSIRQVIKHARNDTTVIGGLIALSERIYTSDPDTNMIICKQAIDLADRALGKSGTSKQLRSTLLRQKATAVNNLAVSHYIFGQLDSALACFRRAGSIHESNGYPAGVADALNNEGLVHEARGDHALQQACLFKALAIYRRASDDASTAKALNNIGQYFDGRGMMDSALYYHESSMAVSEAMHDDRGMANSMLNIGMNHMSRGRPAEALERFLVCEKTYEALGDKVGLATTLNNIAVIYHNQGIPAEALAYYHRAMDINTALGDRASMANNRMNSGDLLVEQGEWDLAKIEFEKSLALFTEAGDKGGEAIVHGHLGNLWKNKGDKVRALGHLRTSLRLSRELDSPDQVSTALYKLGHFHEDDGSLDSALAYYEECLGLERSIEDKESESFTLYSIASLKLKEGKLREAQQNAEASLAIARVLGFPVNIMRAAGVLQDVFSKQGKWGPALEMLELHQQMKDSVNNAENAKKTVRLQLRYGFEKKQLADSLAHVSVMGELENEKRIATLESEQARNRSWAFGVGGLLLLGGGGVVYRVDRKRRRERFERDAARLQTRILRTQMNPHFIFNALNSINNYVQTNDREVATGFLTKFAQLMRLVLESSRHSEVSLKDDLEALRLYMDLERARMHEKFDYSILVDPSIDPDTTLVPPLVAQPFVENAIWHGVSAKEGKGHIIVRVERRDATLVMTIEDDGVGREPTAGVSPTNDQPPKTSLGTSITRDRLEMLGKQHGMDSGFLFTDLPQGTRVEVSMPLIAA